MIQALCLLKFILYRLKTVLWFPARPQSSVALILKSRVRFFALESLKKYEETCPPCAISSPFIDRLELHKVYFLLTDGDSQVYCIFGKKNPSDFICVAYSSFMIVFVFYLNNQLSLSPNARRESGGFDTGAAEAVN